jgi:amidase
VDTLLDAPAVKLADAIRARDVSSVEVVSAFLERIDALNPPVNAVVQVPADLALARARQADDALADGLPVGPLHGVPFTAKDIFATAGVVTAAGLTERATFVPETDAVVVARMQAAGAILLGKTNCPPYGGGGVTNNPVYGRTNNPYNLEYSAGGSSGGEAAAQAAGFSPFGLGSDSGGSIRLPAHYCGVAGLKPTTGRVPNTGAFELPGGLTDVRTQIGPISRFAADLWPAFVAIAGPDWRDSGVVPVPLGDPASVSLEGLRLAWFDNDGIVTPTPATIETVRKTAAALDAAGLDVSQARPPALEEVSPVTRGYWGMRRLSGAEVEDNILRWDRLRTMMLTFMDDYDAILCPVDHQPAVPHGTEDPNQFSYTLAWSLTGWPCVVVRAGTSPEGLPINVQIVARPWREDVAVAVGLEVERLFGGWQPAT